MKEENWITYTKREIQGIWYVIENEGSPTQKNLRCDNEEDAKEKMDKLILGRVNMARNKNPELEKERNKAQSLEDLLLDIEKREENLEPISDGNPELEIPRLRMDFESVKNASEDEAKEILNSVVNFYLEADLISKKEYIVAKQKVDELTLSNILFAMRTAQYAITKALEEINLGNSSHGIFSSLASLQAQLMNMVKHQAAYSVTLQESYKQIKEDAKILTPNKMKELEGNVTLELDGNDVDGFKVRGQKDLIRTMKESANIEEAEFDEAGLVDAKKRPEPPDHAKGEEKEEKNDFDIDEEHF